MLGHEDGESLKIAFSKGLAKADTLASVPGDPTVGMTLVTGRCFAQRAVMIPSIWEKL